MRYDHKGCPNCNKLKRKEKLLKDTRTKIYWICKKNHSYLATPYSRTNGSGCPYCSNKRILKGYNDLATTNPELLEIWDYDKNKIKPSEISKGSGKKSVVEMFKRT